MKPLRILLFTESFTPVTNGVTTAVQTLAAELFALGHLPTVVAPHFPGHGTDTDSLFPVIRIPSWRTPLNPDNPFAFPPLPRAASVLDSCDADIVHAHHPFGIGLQAQATAKRLRVPLIATFHTLYQEYGHYVPFLPAPLVHICVDRWLRHFYNVCDAVITPSRYAESMLRRAGVESGRLHVVPTGIPEACAVAAAAISEARVRFGLPTDGSPTFLYVGRLAREKKVEFLLAAMTNLPQSTMLLLVGGGPYTGSLRQTARAFGVAERVRWAGYVAHADLPSLYRAATLFVFASASETQGLVLAEAQSHGLPVICVRGGGASESVRDGVDALVTEPDILAEAIQSLLSDSERRARFADAALHNPIRLTPAESTSRVLAVYRGAVGTRRV